MDNFDLEMQKQEEILMRAYPVILNLYYDYLNSDEYNKSDVAQYTKTMGNLYNQKMQEIITKKQFGELEDCRAEAECFHEREGFIHGFLYASRLMREISKI